MKRLNEYDASDSNKKARYSQQQQQSYNDMYSQYAMNSQAAMMMNSQYAAAGGANGFGGFASPNGMYGAMGYGVPGSTAAFNGGFGSSGYAHPAAFAAAVAMGGNGAANGQGNQPEVSRTIYLGNVPSDAVVSDVFDTIRVGAVESLKFLTEKSCAFLTFVDPLAAQHYYQQYLATKLIIKNKEVKVGWGKYTPREKSVQEAIQRGGTRNVYFGSVDESVTEEALKLECAKFGYIDQCRIVREKNCAFVHFASIASAAKCIASLSHTEKWVGKRINYGKDRCAQIQMQLPPVQQPHMDPKAAGQAGASGSAGQQASQDGQEDQYGGFGGGFQHAFRFDPYSAQGYTAAAAGGNNTAQRTLYLGSINEEATCEDLCNAIRGGILYQIRYLPEKHIAFVTFVDPMAAMNLYSHAQTIGLVVKGRRVKVGWGKPSSIHAATIMAVQNGASRNIYIGNMEEGLDEAKLRKDFEQFGEIELINTLQERNCAFVNFTNITNAMKALAAIKHNPDYRKYRLNYGKDRCGNPFKPRAQQQHQQPQEGNNEGDQEASKSKPDADH